MNIPFGIFRFADFRLIDLPGLRECLPLTTTELRKHVQQSSEEGAKFLTEKWIPACVEIVSNRREDIESWMPGEEVKTWGKLFNLIKIVMRVSEKSLSPTVPPKNDLAQALDTLLV